MLVLLIFLIINVNCKIWNIRDAGAKPSDKSISTCNNNTKIVNQLLNNKLQPYDTLLIPNNEDYWFNGRIYASNISDIIIQIDGSINYQSDRKYWHI